MTEIATVPNGSLNPINFGSCDCKKEVVGTSPCGLCSYVDSFGVEALLDVYAGSVMSVEAELCGVIDAVPLASESMFTGESPSRANLPSSRYKRGCGSRSGNSGCTDDNKRKRCVRDARSEKALSESVDEVEKWVE